MDTSNSTIGELAASDLPEDRELAGKCVAVIEALITELVPVLKYIVPPQQIRHGHLVGDEICTATGFSREYFVPLLEGKNQWVVLKRSGQVCFAHKCHANGAHHWHIWGNNFTRFLFSEFTIEPIVASLQQILVTARQMQEQHQSAVRKREEKLDQILAILKK